MMRIVRFTYAGTTSTGVLDGERLVPVGPGTDAAVLDLAMAVRDDPSLRPAATGEPVPLSGARLLAPVGAPPSLRDFYAFEQHVVTARRSRGLDADPDWYEIPVFYFSNPAAVVGPGEPVPVPPRSQALDYELEVAVVLGRGGRDVPPGDADALVAGFCILNDWSARDVQMREMRQSLGPAKGKDFATSLGPMLVTADEFAPGGLRRVSSAEMVARVNGEEYSRGNLATLWWSFAEMIGYASESATLCPGDVLGSGTCGTGCILELSLVHGGAAYPWLQPGDEVELSVEGLGVLANPVAAPASPPWAPDPARTRPARYRP